MYFLNNGPLGENPCKEGEAGNGACDESALCVRSATEKGFACLCPDGLVPLDEATVGVQRKCVIPRGAAGGSEGAGAGADGSAACALACGPGACVRGAAGAPHCRCPPLFTGERCQHYRCAQHCHRRGRCELDKSRPIDPIHAADPTVPLPLKVQYDICQFLRES